MTAPHVPFPTLLRPTRIEQDGIRVDKEQPWDMVARMGSEGWSTDHSSGDFPLNWEITERGSAHFRRCRESAVSKRTGCWSLESRRSTVSTTVQGLQCAFRQSEQSEDKLEADAGARVSAGTSKELGVLILDSRTRLESEIQKHTYAHKMSNCAVPLVVTTGSRSLPRGMKE